MKVQKFKVAETGKVIKVRPVGNLLYEDIKTGKRYDIGDLEIIHEKHSAAWGFHIGNFGIYLFAREYFKYRSYNLGATVQNPSKGIIDFEIKFLCFGAGVRFIIMGDARKTKTK